METDEEKLKLREEMAGGWDLRGWGFYYTGDGMKRDWLTSCCGRCHVSCPAPRPVSENILGSTSSILAWPLLLLSHQVGALNLHFCRLTSHACHLAHSLALKTVPVLLWIYIVLTCCNFAPLFFFFLLEQRNLRRGVAAVKKKRMVTWMETNGQKKKTKTGKVSNLWSQQ